MKIDRRTFNWHGAFNKLSCLPILVRGILFKLISSSIINKADFFTHYRQRTSNWVDFMISINVFECCSESFNAMWIINFGLEALLVAQIPLILLYYEQNPELFEVFSLISFGMPSAHTLYIVRNTSFECSPYIIVLFFGKSIFKLRVGINIIVER